MPSVPLIGPVPLWRPGRAAPDRRRPSHGGPPAVRRRARASSLAHQHQRAVGQRCEVPAASEGPVGRHHRGDPVVEQRHHRLGHRRAHAGAAGGQGPGPQQHEGAHHLGGHRRTHPRRVRPDEAPLQLGPQRRADVAGGQGPEAGGDPVDRGGRGGRPRPPGPGCGPSRPAPRGPAGPAAPLGPPPAPRRPAGRRCRARRAVPPSSANRTVSGVGGSTPPGPRRVGRHAHHLA